MSCLRGFMATEKYYRSEEERFAACTGRLWELLGVNADQVRRWIDQGLLWPGKERLLPPPNVSEDGQVKIPYVYKPVRDVELYLRLSARQYDTSGFENGQKVEGKEVENPYETCGVQEVEVLVSSPEVWDEIGGFMEQCKLVGQSGTQATFPQVYRKQVKTE